MALRPESDFGETKNGRIGNPFLYAQRVFILILNSMFSQESILSITSTGSDNQLCTDLIPNPYRVYCNEDGTIDRARSTITVSHVFSKEDTSTQPQIIVGRGPASWSDMTIGDMGKPLGVGVYAGRKPDTRAFTDLLYIPINIEIYGEDDLQVEDLAWLVSGFIKLHEQEIRRGCFLYKIMSPTVGSVAPTEVGADYKLFKAEIALAVHISLAWTRRSTLNIEALQAGICKLSDSDLPRVIKDICVVADVAQ